MVARLTELRAGQGEVIVGKNGKHKAAVAATESAGPMRLTIPAPNFKVASFRIRGNVPYVQLRFSEKQKEELHGKHAAGSQAAKGKKRTSKDFQANYEQAMYVMEDGSHGIPAAAFRAGMIDACRMAGFKMTLAKMSVFVLADGMDKSEPTPLVKITKGKPEYFESVARNANGQPDLRVRALWKAGWEAIVKVRFDADQFQVEDVANLLMRVGTCVGVGEGRAFSKNSCGQGWGLFDLIAE